MANKKVDGVVEAVRYNPDGKVNFVRAFLRRGPTWSDHVLLTRDELVAAIKSGQRMFIGRRIIYMAGTFDLSSQVQIKNSNGGEEVLYTTQPVDDRDNLEGLPIF
jgi:hypothetical protein